MRKDSNNKRQGSDRFKKDEAKSRGGDKKPYKREDTDKPKRRKDNEERPKRTFGDIKPDKSDGDRPNRSFDGDRQKRSFDDKPKRSFGKRDDAGGEDRPKRSFGGDKPKRPYGTRDTGGEGNSKRPYGTRNDGENDRPKRSFDNDRPKRSFSDDKPKRSFGKRDEGNEDHPKRSFDSDRPKKSFDSDKPKRSFDGKSKRDTDKKGGKKEDQPKRGFSMDRVFDGEKPKRDFNIEDIERPDKPQPFTKELESEWDKKQDKGKVRHKSFDQTVGKIRTKKGTDMDAYVEKKLQKADKPKRDKKAEEGEDSAELMPLNKYIAHSGECSRREAAELVKLGKVKVNGELVTDPGHKVTREDKVTVAGKKMILQHDHVYILLNKPKGFITTTDDPEGRRTVMELVESAGVERIFPVGRLDRATTGLLLMTNDGALAQKLSHPSHSIKKVYQVTLDKPITKADFDKVVAGVELEDGIANVDALAILENKNELGLEIHIGKNRIVRRIFEYLGYRVEKLDRVMYAGLTKKNLPRSKWRFLTEKEVILLKHFKN